MRYEFERNLYAENKLGLYFNYYEERGSKLSAAIYIAMQKWHPDNPQRGEGECVLCALFSHKSCKGCPLGNCSHGSLFYKYLQSEGAYNMDMMYNKLVELYELELEKEALIE